MQKTSIIEEILVHLAALVVALAVIAPPLWLFISSISTEADLLRLPLRWIPENPTFDRYIQVFSATGTDAAAVFRQSMINSFIVAAAVTALCLVFGSLAAYSFARMGKAGHGSLINLMLFSYMLPPIMLVVPLYSIMARIGLTDRLEGLILIYSALIMPFSVWIMRGFFQTIPRELEEAAMIDGSTRLGALLRVVIPISTPGLVATGLLCFLMSWEEFLIALIFTSSPSAKTVPVAIAEFTGRHSIDFGMMSTGGVIAAIPAVLLAIVFQRYLVSGLTSGAVKA
jgi:multiple sugar transport system permease protein